MKVVTIHISLTATRICTILVMLGCVQTYATPSRIRELEKDAVNNSEILEFGTEKENNQGGSPLYTIDYDQYGNITQMNRLHEIFHTIGLTHPKRVGGNQGIMKYPPQRPTKKDALELINTEYLPKIIEK